MSKYIDDTLALEVFTKGKKFSKWEKMKFSDKEELDKFLDYHLKFVNKKYEVNDPLEYISSNLSYNGSECYKFRRGLNKTCGCNVLFRGMFYLKVKS